MKALNGEAGCDFTFFNPWGRDLTKTMTEWYNRVESQLYGARTTYNDINFLKSEQSCKEHKQGDIKLLHLQKSPSTKQHFS